LIDGPRKEDYGEGDAATALHLRAWFKRAFPSHSEAIGDDWEYVALEGRKRRREERRERTSAGDVKC